MSNIFRLYPTDLYYDTLGHIKDFLSSGKLNCCFYCYFYCCCRQSTQLGSKHKSRPTCCGLWFQYHFLFPRSFQGCSPRPHACYPRAEGHAVVQFSKPASWFRKGVPHMYSSAVSFRLHTQIWVIFFSASCLSMIFPTFCFPGPFH